MSVVMFICAFFSMALATVVLVYSDNVLMLISGMMLILLAMVCSIAWAVLTDLF